MGEVGAAYGGCRARIAEMVGGLDEAGAAVTVPTCPEWTVHDVVAHLAGVADDALAGRLDGVATAAWTAAQVEPRRGRSLSEVLDEWAGKAPAFEELLDAIGDPGRQAVADIVTHEHDIRAALRQPGARNSEGVKIGLGFVAPALVDSASRRGASLRVHTMSGLDFGGRDARVVLIGEAFELLRAMTGRRSAEQLGALQWRGEAQAVIPAFTFGPFHPAATDIDE